MAPGNLVSPSPLQEQCCRAISLCADKIPENLLEELNRPCLGLLVEHLSMFDLLRYEKILQKQGIDTQMALYKLQRILFANNETYPIKSTTCPHLLDLFPCDGWGWGLSRLLYRRAIVQLIEEYDKREELTKEVQKRLVELHPYLLDLFCPINTKHRDKIKQRVLESDDMVEKLAALAARHIIFITVDNKLCKFLLNKKFEDILNGFCESVLVISLILKSSVALISFIKTLKEKVKKLERICINVIRKNDLLYFDSLLTICSGVVSYYTTAEGRREKEILHAVVNESIVQSARERAEQPAEYQSIEQDLFNTPVDAEFDLMDDAVLFGTPSPPSKYDSNDGMLKGDLKFTNLVEKQLYVSVLNHHLRYWLSLRELHLGVPDLHPKLVEGICNLLTRPQFKCFTLSSADFSPSVMDDILSTVATSRNSNPLDKLMFVSIQEKVDSIAELLVTDHLRGKSEEEVEIFVKQFESERIAKCRDFTGTKLLEIFHSTLGVKTECILLGYVLRDSALTNVCFSNSISRLFIQYHLSYLRSKNRQLNMLILEDWSLLSSASCNALSSLLLSVSTSLHSLCLKTCLNSPNAVRFTDVLDAISKCKNIKYLDLSENNFGESAIPFLTDIVDKTQVKELSLKRNEFSFEAVVLLLKQISALKNNMLEIVDLRGNRFFECHRKRHGNLLQSVARYVLVNFGSSPEEGR